jgi:metallo-beta-lactamase class B
MNLLSLRFSYRYLLHPLLLAAAVMASAAHAEYRDWPFPAHRVVGNVYYVGSKEFASYLITTPQGNILINSGAEATVPLIRDSIEKLGFNMRDVRILLDSHAHWDHVGGHARMKELTGARVLVMAGDDGVVGSGGKGDFHYTDSWPPVVVDGVLHDGDVVELGGVKLTAHLTPGHTRGCTTWSMDAEENGTTYKVVIVGSPNVNPGFRLVNNEKYPEIADDYARAFAVMKNLPCDVFLGSHGAFYGMEQKYARLKQDPSVNPFIDPDGYQRYIAGRERAFLAELDRQKRAAAKPG